MTKDIPKFNSKKTNSILHHTETYSPYRAVNTLRLVYKNISN